MNKARDFDPSVVAELKALLGERVSTSAAVREHHGKDESYFPYALPDAVVFPATTEEVRDSARTSRTSPTRCPTRWCSPRPPRKCATSSTSAGATACR